MLSTVASTLGSESGPSDHKTQEDLCSRSPGVSPSLGYFTIVTILFNCSIVAVFKCQVRNIIRTSGRKGMSRISIFPTFYQVSGHSDPHSVFVSLSQSAPQLQLVFGYWVPSSVTSYPGMSCPCSVSLWESVLFHFSALITSQCDN